MLDTAIAGTITLLHAHEYLRKQWVKSQDENVRLGMKMIVDILFDSDWENDQLPVHVPDQ